ncbi:hypothetical protein PGTUg99_037244 [Puccinia graminis f. sp. tritici]|uniref:Importin-7/11-like TPR repeats domain-containing protein n=1 Tax=Puccinia graminis f. sp. tritici TaxID=56615 RepID=A0A5B0PMP4_PUCGR|nr:hypothetical protein PGTUg99_037244 [Puccinia graminis f. sp. tritici]
MTYIDQQAIGPSSQDYHPAIIVFVEHSINPNNPLLIYLQEDGLILWLAINSKTGRDADTQPDQTTLRSGHLNRRCERLLMGMPMGLAPTKTILQSVECIIKCANPSVWQAWFEESDCFLQLMQGSTSTDDQLQQDVPSALSW